MNTSPLAAIKEHCLDCCCGIRSEVGNCTVTSCALYPFRQGKNPFSQRGKNMTDEQKQAVAERMKKARESRKNNT